MESQVFEFLVLAAMTAAVIRRLYLCAFLVALAALTRPEGFLLAGILGLILIVRSIRARQPLPWRVALVFGSLIIPWVLFALLHFGSPIPNSALAKASSPGISATTWAHFFLLRNPLIVSVWIAAGVGVLWAALHRSGTMQLLAIWAATYSLFFLAARPPFLGNWYFPPLASPLLGLAAVGAVWAAQHLTFLRPRTVLLAVAAAWVVVLVAVSPRAINTLRWSRAVANSVYRPMGIWIRDHTQPNDLIQICDIGYVGYLSDRRILDASALVSPDVWRAKVAARGNGSGSAQVPRLPRPDILVIPLKARLYTQAIAEGTFETYEPVARFQLDGRAELWPAKDPGIEYERRGQWRPDFLVCKRVPPSGE